MSEVHVYYLGSNQQPYAHVQGSDNKGFHYLGVTRNALGFKNGFDQTKAREEAKPAFGHQALELTLALFGTEHAELMNLEYNSVAVACLASNEQLPKELQHEHRDYLKAIGKTREEIKSLNKEDLNAVDETLDGVYTFLLANPQLYSDANLNDLKEGVLYLHNQINTSSAWHSI